MSCKCICCKWDKQVCLPLHTQKSSSNISPSEELWDKQRHTNAHGWGYSGCLVPWLGRWDGSCPDTLISPLRLSPPGDPCGTWHRAFVVVSTGEQKQSPQHLWGCCSAAGPLGALHGSVTNPDRLYTACVLLPSQTSSPASRNDRSVIQKGHKCIYCSTDAWQEGDGTSDMGCHPVLN